MNPLSDELAAMDRDSELHRRKAERLWRWAIVFAVLSVVANVVSIVARYMAAR